MVKESTLLAERLGLTDVLEVQAHSLPYGLQRRVEVARALATKPRLLLLDEPATGMSAEEIAELFDFVAQLRKDFGLTILLVEHTMRVVMTVCPRIVVLNHGETIAEGTPEQIQSNEEVIAAYLGGGWHA